MKKAIIAAAALALMLPARAETFEVGTAGKTGMNGSVADITPINPEYSYSGNQSLYTVNELSKLHSIGADGAVSAAEITKISIEFTSNENYWSSYGMGATEIKVYLTNTDATEFEKTPDNKYKWLTYTTDYVATGSLTTEDIENAMYGPVTLELTLDKPFRYEGGSILLTWDNATEDVFDSCVEPFYGFKTDVTRCLYTNSNAESFADVYATGIAPKTTNFVPCVTFDYTMVTEAAPGPVRGEAAEFAVGPYDAPEYETPSSPSAYLPINPDYDHSFAQTLYTAPVLSGLNKVEDGKNVKAEISEITFKMWADGDYYTGQSNVTVYVENTDATTFPVVGGKKQWFDYSKAVKGVGQSEEYDYYEAYGEDFTITVKLETPIIYEGQSLLITWIGDGHIEALSGCSLQSEVFSTDKATYSGATAGSSDLSATAGNLENGSSNLPVLKLGYVPVTEAATVTPVMFENVEVALEGLTVDSAVASRLGNYKTVNNVAVRFSLADASDCGEYEIKMGSTSLGTITSTDATINFVSVPKADIVLSVVPKGEGTIGTTYTVAAADIEALFPAPAVEMADYGLYTAYDLATARRATIEAAAQFRMTTPVPAARMIGNNPTGNARLMTTSGDYPACLEHLVPAHATTSDFSDLALNDGLIAYYSANLTEIDLVDGALDMPDNLRISVEFKAGYPVLTQTVPTLTEGRGKFKAEGTADITSADSRTVALLQVDFVGNSYPKNACVARLIPDEAHFTADVTYPAELKAEVDKIARTIKFTAPAGTTLWYAFTADEAAETYALDTDTDEPALEWTKAPSNPWIFDMALNGSGTLQVKTVNDTTSDESEISSYRITADGSLSGIADATLVPADSAAEYYDLRGVRVAGALAPGLYIRRQGGKVAKFIRR